MKAAVLTRYGPPETLQIREVPTPIPGDDEILIRVHAAAVTQGDSEVRSFRMPLLIWLPMRLALAIQRLGGPLISGTDMAGVVESVGAKVTRYAPGDRLFGSTGLGAGACAEYVTVGEVKREGPLAAMPGNATFAEAAALPLGGIMAQQFSRKVNLQPGQRVLIVGAGGSIGVCALQYAKKAGAYVAAVDRANKLEMLRSLGADAAIDCEREDFARDGATYDVVFDVVGKDPYGRLMRCLRPRGIYALANLRLNHHLRGLWARLVAGQRVTLIMQNDSSEDLAAVEQAVEDGWLRPMVDRTYPFDEIVEAHRYLDSGLKKGNIVLTMSGDT